MSLGQKADPRVGEELFDQSNYLDAMKVYEILVDKEPDNSEYPYKLGLCYLRTRRGKKNAVEYLQKARELDHGEDELYYLGKAFTHDHKFDKAIKLYEKYLEKGGGDVDDKRVKRAIKNASTAKELVKYPLNVEFENMGSKINSEFPDYYPYVSKNEEVMVFTSRRSDNVGANKKEFDGYYPSDIWKVEKADDGNEFEEAENMGRKINGRFDEQAVGLSDDGKRIYIYIDHVDEKGDIYVSKKKRFRYGRMEKLGDNVNSDALETSASISADEQTLFFTSAREPGMLEFDTDEEEKAYGGLDLYMSRKLPTGEWAKPQNLGPKVNTAYDEGFPTLSYDNETLYFCSEGHASMGGFDLFKSEWDPEENRWSEPENIGYPINTTKDDRTISYTRDGDHAYVSQRREDSKGDLDIYRVTFKGEAERPAIYKLKLPKSKSAVEMVENAPDSVEFETDEIYHTDAMVTLLTPKYERVGQYAPNRRTGAYTIALQPGEYVMEIEIPGGKVHSREMKVSESDRESGVQNMTVIPGKKKNKDKDKKKDKGD